MTIKILPALLLIFLASCSEKFMNNDQNLDYGLRAIEFNSPGCQPETEACLMIKINYPNFNSGDSLAMLLANRIIKNSILDNIGMGDVESTEEPSLDQAIEDLSKSFEEIKKEFGVHGTGWQGEISTTELFRSDSILVLESSTMTYFGGAHPNRNTRYFNLNRKAGNMIPLTVIIKDLEKFRRKAEKAFNEKYGINDDNTYDKAGYQFLGGRFSLSANYAFLGDSIRLHYNPYEIAPYSMGDSEITVDIN